MNNYYFKILSFVSSLRFGSIRSFLLDIVLPRFGARELEVIRNTQGVPVNKFLISTLEKSERAVLVEEIIRYGEFSSLIEIGAAYGQNFDILARVFPKVNFVGVDIDIDSVKIANRDNKFSNVEYHFGSGADLRFLEHGSFDIAIMSAVSLYLDDNDLNSVIEQLQKKGVKKLFLLEMHDESTDKTFLVEESDRPPYFLRNYEELFKARRLDYKKIKISNPIWTIERWSDLATLFVVSL